MVGDDPAATLDESLYPDVVEAGGLALALRGLARRRGIDVGDISASEFGPLFFATIDSPRGGIGVQVVPGRRSFYIVLSHRSHKWARGETDDLLDVLRVAELWRGGAMLSELASTFPFMSYRPIEEAYERGDHVPVQWQTLLQDADLDEIRPLLRAAHENERLRELFPTVSHFTLLRLELDAENRSAGSVRIERNPAGDYRVVNSWSEVSRQAGTLDQAVAAAVAALPERSDR
ncbi:DUF6193 family natural product biosynthesis protein [Micromonospora sp. NPDC050417]|uniref:DUF6193 family natural product biosynthesis protein n=1 Tax=Micromonospora sp. NPDC050417 TaxID=3364280 RepID=UPI0037B94AA1